MMSVDVWKKDSGKLWHRKPHAGDDGVILTISHNVAGALSGQNRSVRFLHAAFDVSGDNFVAGDHQGNIYRFDIHRNRFNLVKKTGTPCTALAFTLRRRSEFLAGMSDYSLKCFDTDTKQQVASMEGHSSVIHNISLHASGRYALTSSLNTAQLWDLDTFQRKRKLNIKENVGIVKVFFLPLSNTIMTCFKDDSIFAWEADTLSCKYQLHIPEGKAPHFKAFTSTRDGRTLVAGGKSRYLHVWALETKKLLRIVELPAKITTVKQLEFLNDSFDGGSTQVLGVLAQDGIMRFIDLGTCKLLFDIGSRDQQRIASVTVSSSGRHIVGVLDDGKVCVYNVQSLTQDINKPPPPLVKVLKSNKMADSKDGSTMVNSSLGQRSKASKDSHNNNVMWTHDSTETELPAGLSMPRLMAILKGYGEFPAKYRMFIWRNLLHLPENHQAYGALVDKGTHPAYDNLHEKYPIKSRKLLRVLQRVLSALAHWAPIFGETDFLPMMAFPFVKLFQNNQLVCFEIIATTLVSWCQHWFEYFPNPPVNMLGLVENLLAHHDKELLQHFVRYGVTSQVYAWPLLQTLYSEVMTRDEWLKLFDNVFSNEPSFILMLTVAYSVCNRTPLLKCTEQDDFTYFFHNRNAVDVQQVIKEAYRIRDCTPDDLQPNLEPFTPLTRGQYPVFNKYPKFIVDYQVQERERIRTEEQEYLRQRQLSHELQTNLQRKVEEEEAWYRQQKLLLDAEERRRKLIAEEEQKLADQRTRLAALDRETNVKKVQLMDATRRKFMKFQQHHKEAELTRLDDEIRRKAILRDTETEAALDAAEIQHLELQLQRKAFEQELMRGHMETAHKHNVDLETRRLQEELEDRKMRLAQRAERDEARSLRQTYEDKLGKVDNALADLSMRHDTEVLHKIDDASRQEKMVQLNKLTTANRRLEGDIQDLMSTVEKEKVEEARRRLNGLPSQQEFYRMEQEQQEPETEETVESSNFSLLEEARMQGTQESRSTMQRISDRLRQVHIQEESPYPLPGTRPYLNDTTSTETSAPFSLDRGRDSFEQRQRDLMSEVTAMRQKRAVQNRTQRPPSQQSSFA